MSSSLQRNAQQVIRTGGLNPLTSTDPIWYSGPDLATAKLQTGQVPKIIEAFKLVSQGHAEGNEGHSHLAMAENASRMRVALGFSAIPTALLWCKRTTLAVWTSV
jgi:hypothetical protein